MIQELLYTSCEGKGLRKGSGGGYCTVQSTQGMASNLADALEKLSGYKHPFDLHDERSEKSPTNYRHLTLRVGGVSYHILSRIADVRHEHTGRSNKLAHHLVLPSRSLPVGGPSWILSDPKICHRSWDGNVRLVPEIEAANLPSDDIPFKKCEMWGRLAGDPGWSGHVADRLINRDNDPVYVIFPLGTDTLGLVNEVFSLIPPKKRWSVTFSTYFTNLVAGTSCDLRFVLDGTPEAAKIRRDFRRMIVDLAGELGVPKENQLVEAARTGRLVATVTDSEPLAKQPGPQEDLVGSPQTTSAPSRVAEADRDDYRLAPPAARSEVQRSGQDVTFQSSHDLYKVKRQKAERRRKRIVYFVSTLAGVVLACLIAKFVAGLDSPQKLADGQSHNGPDAKADSTDATSSTGTKEASRKARARAESKDRQTASRSDEARVRQANKEPRSEKDPRDLDQIANRETSGSPNSVNGHADSGDGQVDAPPTTNRQDLEPLIFGSNSVVLNPPLGSPSRRQHPTTVITLLGSPQAEAKLDVVGLDLLTAPNKNATYQLRETSRNNWKIFRITKGKFKPSPPGRKENTDVIAEFERSDLRLTIAWPKKPDSRLARMLKWCALRLDSGEKITQCQLMKPITAMPKLTYAKTTDEGEWIYQAEFKDISLPSKRSLNVKPQDNTIREGFCYSIVDGATQLWDYTPASGKGEPRKEEILSFSWSIESEKPIVLQATVRYLTELNPAKQQKVEEFLRTTPPKFRLQLLIEHDTADQISAQHIIVADIENVVIPLFDDETPAS